MNYWIFKCNPEYFKIDERLKNKEPKTTWQINQHKDEPPQNGDMAFIWRTGNTVFERGFVAVMNILADAKEMDEFPYEEQYYTDKGREKLLKETCRIIGNFQYKLYLISSDRLKGEYGLTSLSGIFSGRKMGTTFRLTNDEGEKLIKTCKKNIKFNF